ncbi:ribosome biogenesis GTP-binding protein YihA/YsxC [Candidatus Liberibacter sp.]|uniref:ribosome biogenesis GTP-binding protein YihA/YsxC n=1 Tax=Candidatus Liberibacter sp. TaxID=34022 RepID=UPI0015F47265|nr:ribosome biogenesis GTP-binding protein YihA/YsxC [Candidatus Liberibacter sp.]MBA5724136.1 YihA family ribosome biogenesis GTP-binding protein [Candidatus Liberibacter sp.]
MSIDHKVFSGSPWIFLRGVPEVELLPEAGPPEIAFSGRSNVGKSSLINLLVNQKKLARTSNSPGRTQEINYFIPDGYSGTTTDLPPIALVDMPGYGYAKAPKGTVFAWGQLVLRYLCERSTLRRVFLLIDCRHGIKKTDEDVFSFLDVEAVPYQIVLTKIDKINPKMAENKLKETKDFIGKHPACLSSVISTSSVRKEGIESLRQSIIEAINKPPRHN